MRALGGGTTGAWDDLVLSLPRPHVLQSEVWGQFKSAWGWAPHRMAWGPVGSEWAAAQVLVRHLAGGAMRLAYVPRGPILRRPDAVDAWIEVLRDLRQWARRNGVVAIKIDPGLPGELSHVADAWREAGWRPVVKEVQFPNTMESDLTVGEDGLLSAMKQKTRYNVRLASRRGVHVRRGSTADLAGFFRLYAATAARAGFAIRQWPYYRDAWTALLGTGRAALLLAELDGRALAACLPVAYGDTAWFLYGASGDAGREHMPSHLAQWESLRWAIASGCRRYDWWGGPTRMEPDDPMWGVYLFKAGFGARLVRQLGAWEAPGSRSRYAAFRLAERARAGWLRARSGRATAGGEGGAAL